MKNALLATCLLLAPVTAAAQETSALALEIDRLARAEPVDVQDLVGDLRDNLWKAVYLAPAQADVAEILAFRRADVQTGAGSGASGTTTTVIGPLLPAIFGVALEDGSITRTVSGTTFTINVNPAGLVCASRPGLAMAVARREADGCASFWRRVGLAAAFDTARSEQPERLQGLQSLGDQFAELAVRVELVNRRTASGQRYVQLFDREFTAWKEAATAFAAVDRTTPEIQKAAGDLEVRLTAMVATPAWQVKAPEARAEDIRAQIEAVLAPAMVPEAQASQVRAAWLVALRADRGLQNAIANAPVVTAEYRFQRPDMAAEAIGSVVAAGLRPPSLHTARVVYGQGLGRRSLDFTANASVTWFDEARPGMSGRFRDARAGLEGTFMLRDLRNYGAPTLSFAGLYMYLHQEPLGLGLELFDQQEIDEPGHIGVFQAKLEFPTASNTIRLPLSFTYSNRTELIREADVRGQFGISVNLDALFAEGR